MPRVLNKKRDFIPHDAIYVGRPSKWGNPYSHLGYGLAKFRVESAQKAVECYEKWLLSQPQLMNAISELRGKDLVCWCAPGPCHATILMKLANK